MDTAEVISFPDDSNAGEISTAVPFEDVNNNTVKTLFKLNNSDTHTHYKYSASTTPLFMSIYLGIGILGIFGNSLVSFIMLRYRKLRSRLTNVFVLNQSLIDFVISCVLVAVQVTDDISWVKTDIQAYLYCRLWLSKYILWSLFVSSSCNLLVLTMERYLAIVHSLTYKRLFSRKKARIMMVMVWFFGTFWNLYDLFSSNMRGKECSIWTFWPSELFQRLYGIAIVTVQYFIPLAVFTFAYGRIIYVLHRKALDGVRSDEIGKSRVRAQSLSSATNREMRMLKARTNVIKTLVMVSFCFVICWGPNQLLFFLHMIGLTVDYQSWYYHWTVMMTFLNSCVNPIIYTLKYKEFQECLRNSLCTNSATKGEAGNSSGTERTNIGSENTGSSALNQISTTESCA